MEVLKKHTIEFLFIFFLTFGYIFFYSLAVPFDSLNTYFSIPFRIVMIFVSFYIIYINFENIKRRKLTIIFMVLFWVFYLIKANYSFKNGVFLPKVMKNEYQVYIRIIFLNLLPYIAVLSINLSKDIMMKLNSWAFNFLLIIIGISSLYAIFVTHVFERASGIFASYYISAGHYGLSLVILSVFYYFQFPNKMMKPILGILLGIFTIFISSARSPMLAALILSLIFLIYLNKLKYWVALISFVIIFIVGIYYLKQSSLSDFAFVNRMYDGIFRGDGYGRSANILKGWDIFKSNMLLGGSILFEDGSYPHNIFVEVLMSMGIIGFILLCLYFKDLVKFRLTYIKDQLYNLPYFLFFIQYFILVVTSYTIFANMEFWSFAAVAVSIILFCYDEKIKSNDRRGNTTGNH